MKFLKVLTFVVGITILLTANTMASLEVIDPFKGISRLVAFFQDLNASFDVIVEKEKKSQLVRNIDRIRKDVYKLEIDTRFFIDSLPTHRPDDQEWDQINIYLNDLWQTLESVRRHLRKFGADLRLSYKRQGVEVEQALRTGVQSRAMVLTYARVQLSAMYRGDIEWDPSEVRGRAEFALKAVKDAQVAITELQRKLQSEE